MCSCVCVGKSDHVSKYLRPLNEKDKNKQKYMFPCKIAAIPVFAVKCWLSQIGLPQVH